MPKYRQKPFVIDAFRLGFDEIPDWFSNQIAMKNISFDQYGVDQDLHRVFLLPRVECDIPTYGGTMHGYHGDYIIRNADGEIYPCAPGTFVKTYDPYDKIE